MAVSDAISRETRVLMRASSESQNFTWAIFRFAACLWAIACEDCDGSSVLQLVRATNAPHLPPANKPVHTSISTPEWRFLEIEVLMGKFGGRAEAIRHYMRRGMEAEGVLDDALICG
jgi:hypothetical protein